MSKPKLTRKQIIYLWYTEGGDCSWARWAKLYGIPVRDPNYIKELKRAANGEAESEE